MSKWQLTETGKDGVRERLRPIVEQEYTEEDQEYELNRVTAELAGYFEKHANEVGLAYDDEYGTCYADGIDYMTNIDVGRIRVIDFATDYEWEQV